MNAWLFSDRIRKVFSKPALVALFSFLALSFAAIESGAVNRPTLMPDLSTIAPLKRDFFECPAPYSTEYCIEQNKLQNSCAANNKTIFDDLSFSSFTNAGMKPYCPLRNRGEVNPSDS